jgi:hypothetical protein
VVSEQGGLRAAKTFLHKEGYSDGFVELWQCGRLDISMEALVLRKPWSSLFTAAEFAIARRRLQELELEPT